MQIERARMLVDEAEHLALHVEISERLPFEKWVDLTERAWDRCHRRRAVLRRMERWIKDA